MTAQIHERLIYAGEEMSMAYCPPLPEGHPRLLQVDPQASLGDAPDGFLLYSTGCWRRYQGTWEIKDGHFYLVGLRGIFRLEGDEPLLADWFSGVIRIPKGEIVHYVHMGFESIFEYDLFVEIEQGVVMDSWEVDNRGRDFGRPGWMPPPGGES
jgi:hypothetical protein